MIVKRVAQEDKNGCVVASLAMITGKTYAQVRDELQPMVGHFEEGEWVPGVDLSNHGLCLETDAYNYLREVGFAVQRMYRCDPATNKRRKEWPVLWVKEHPLFVGYLASTVLNNNSHAVVVEEGGGVIDPWREGSYTLADYGDVQMLLACFNLSEVDWSCF